MPTGLAGLSPHIGGVQMFSNTGQQVASLGAMPFSGYLSAVNQVFPQAAAAANSGYGGQTASSGSYQGGWRPTTAPTYNMQAGSQYMAQQQPVVNPAYQPYIGPSGQRPTLPPGMAPNGSMYVGSISNVLTPAGQPRPPTPMATTANYYQQYQQQIPGYRPPMTVGESTGTRPSMAPGGGGFAPPPAAPAAPIAGLPTPTAAPAAGAQGALLSQTNPQNSASTHAGGMGLNLPLHGAFSNSLTNFLANPGWSEKTVDNMINRGTDEIAERERSARMDLSDKAAAMGATESGGMSAGLRQLSTDFGGQRAGLARDVRMKAETERVNNTLKALGIGGSFLSSISDSSSTGGGSQQWESPLAAGRLGFDQQMALAEFGQQGQQNASQNQLDWARLGLQAQQAAANAASSSAGSGASYTNTGTPPQGYAQPDFSISFGGGGVTANGHTIPGGTITQQTRPPSHIPGDQGWMSGGTSSIGFGGNQQGWSETPSFGSTPSGFGSSGMGTADPYSSLNGPQGDFRRTRGPAPSTSRWGAPILSGGGGILAAASRK